MPRRLTVYLAAPPGDGLRVAREHFHEYVRPVLEKGGVDWDVVEGRREGDVRAGTAERIRRRRRKAEGIVSDEADREAWGSEDAKNEEAIQSVRELNGVTDYEGTRGDIVIGRHVWKEYVRGVHEGWLGPLKRPRANERDQTQLATSDSSTDRDEIWQTTPTSETSSTSTEPVGILSDPPSTTSDDDASPSAQFPSPSEPKPEEKKPSDADSEPKPKKPAPPGPYLPPSAYASAPLPLTIPDTLDPAAIIPYPHILGVLNTRIRLQRYLNQRKVADQIGREVAAALFASSRPLHSSLHPPSSLAASEPWNAPPPASRVDDDDAKGGDELEGALEREEQDWPKSVRKEWEKRWQEDEEKGVRRGESVWLDGVVLDERIAGRMRRFVLDRAEEDRAGRIAKGDERGRVEEKEV